MSTYSIKDLEQLSGIKAHTLRMWEQRYNLMLPKRTDTNIRFYDDEDLKLILNVSLLNDNGYKISKIASMSEEEMRGEVLKLTERSLTYDDQIHSLTLAMIDFDEDRFEKIISTNTLKLGFENTMVNIIYPFLSKIGVLWQTGSINPAQEHFISSLIRQKIIVAIDGQYVDKKANSVKYMLFLPEGELHEMTLLFSYFLIKSRGNRVIYLGQSMPANDLEEAYKVHRPEYILTVVTTTPSQEYVETYLNKLASRFESSTLLVSGYQVVGQDLNLAKNIKVLSNLNQLVEIVEDESENRMTG